SRPQMPGWDRAGADFQARALMTSAVIELNDEQNGEYARDPDVRLMLRAKAGDESAFAELVEKYQNRLVGIFYHLVSDQETAQDLAQEVFLRIYRARKGYVPTAKFSTWLFRIANNLASNSRRSRGRRREVTLTPSESGPMGARPEEQLLADKSSLMPTRQLDRREMREIVRTALDSLNERQRLAVLLHKFEEMSYADIGAAMEMSAAAVKSLLSRARENLRVKLEAYVKAGVLPDLGPDEEEPPILK
ncbi:MAG TPA: sigma-70 family RNA polymerase sigma factor, partial [Planctomycetaceae bacterium]|nr:sigma-70 family RNA polymerase sigma factor [Planctomycetaceae bacterium]